MTTETVDETVDERPAKRYTRPTWVKFSARQRARLGEIAEEQGMALAQVVRQGAVMHYDLPRESSDPD